MKIKGSGFNLNSANESFTNRQKNIFGQLDVIAQDTKLSQNEHLEDMETTDKNEEEFNNEECSKPPKMKSFRGKESIFKKPNSVFHQRLQFSKIPDFKKNPHKWTKYSLKDVSSEDMSDKSNTFAAMSFLKDIEKRKEAENEEEPAKILFKKSKFYKTEKDSEETGANFVNSKLVMPEYVVGKSSKSKKKKNLQPEYSGAEIKLSHLECEDED